MSIKSTSRSLFAGVLVACLALRVAAQPTTAPTNTPLNVARTTGAIVGPVNAPTFAAANGLDTLTGSVTLTNKAMSGSSNTFTNIPNSSLTNAAITIAGTSAALGASITLDTITGLSSTGVLKRTGANTLAIASSGTDYAPATSGGAIQKGNGSGGFSNATYVDLAGVPANSFLGNNTGSVANAIGLTAAQAKVLLAIAYGDVSGLNSMAQQASGAVAITGGTITGMPNPTAGSDVVTKSYADALSQGVAWKTPVRAVSTSNITLSGTQTVDSVALLAGDRVLVAGQSTASQNGIYVVASGSWTRATDADAASEFPSMAAFIQEGNNYGGFGYRLQTTGAITVGTTALAYVQFYGPAAYTSTGGVLQTGTQFSLRIATNSLLGGVIAGSDFVAAGDGTLSLATVNGSPNTFGSATQSLTATVNAKGLLTSLSAQTVTPSYLNVTSVPANTFLGNNTGSPANAIGLTAAQAKTLLAIANTDVSGLGTMSTQNASAIAVTGGTATGITSLGLRDTSAAFDVTLAATSSTALTGGRTLTLDLVNAARTLKLTGNSVLNQDVSTTGSPTFVNVTAALTGNASTATAIATPRAINGVNFDGSAPITVTAAAATLTGTTLNSTVVTSSLAQVGTLGSLNTSGDIVVLTGAAGLSNLYLKTASTGYGTLSMGTTAAPTDFQLQYDNTLQKATMRVAGGAAGLQLTSTGLNSTAIGATTPSTGAFTTTSIRSSSQLRLYTGDNSNNAYILNSGASGTPNIGFYVSGASADLLITATGSVGIGQTPGFKFDVYDSALTSTTLYANVVQRISSHATNADCTIQFSDAINNNTYLSSNLGAWNFATNSKVTQFTISAAGNGAFTGTATATQLISTTSALDVTATLAASVNSVAVFRNQSSTTGTGQDLQFINNGSAAGATNCLGIIRYVQTGANAASSMTIYHNGGSSVNAWISVSSAEAITFPNLTLSAGIKTQAHYFPLTIGATTINVLTD